MDDYRQRIQDLAAQEAAKTAQAAHLQTIAQLLGLLVEEVRELRQDVAAIRASMPRAVTDDQASTAAEREWQDSEADNRGQSDN